jgi:N-acyl-D-amino-acid deacylase
MEKYVIRGGMVVDGSGAKPVEQDVFIENGYIGAIGENLPVSNAKIIDASGKIVCPGFIDHHRHADVAVFSDDFGEIELHQGITTIVSGNCGFSISPCNRENTFLLDSYIKPILGDTPSHYDLFSDYIHALEKLRTKINFGVMVGNGTVRIAVNGFRKDRLNEDQLNRAKWYINEAIESGALGLSMGLMYSPEQYYTGEELVSLCKIIGNRGLITTHIRGSGNNLIPSINEVISIAEKAEVSLEISHLKASGKNNWHESIKKTKTIIDQARSQGLNVHCDVYPYTAGASSLMALMPPLLSEGGIEESIKRLKDPAWRKKISYEFETKHDAWDNLAMSVGWENVVISIVRNPQAMQIKTFGFA